MKWHRGICGQPWGRVFFTAGWICVQTARGRTATHANLQPLGNLTLQPISVLGDTDLVKHNKNITLPIFGCAIKSLLLGNLSRPLKNFGSSCWIIR